MEGSGGNLLELARSHMGPYQSMGSGVVGATSAASQDTRRSLNGWNYSTDPTNGLHSTPTGPCNFTPYSSSVTSLGGTAGPIGSMGHKPSYTPYGATSDLLGSTCQQMPLNQLGPLQSLGPPRQFPFYGDVYQGSPGMGPGGSLFSDLTTIPSIPRYESEANHAYISDNGAQNPGKVHQHPQWSHGMARAGPEEYISIKSISTNLSQS